MDIEYSGWTKDQGSFYCKVFVDENKQDYELLFKNGSIAKQCSPFQELVADWNNDGDVYSQFGAWFERPEGNGAIFWTPVDMVRAAVNGLDKDRFFFDNEVVAVKGISIPPPERRKSLDEMIRSSELRAFHQEAERNRKMDALGIRRPGEPWAR